MKHFTFALFFTMFSMVVGAQPKHNYEIYDWQGTVMHKARGAQEWSLPTKHAPISILDSVDIHKKANIGIVNIQNNQLYRFSETGKSRVKTLIDKAKSKDNAVFSTLNKQLKDNLLSQGDDPSMSVAGATVRSVADTDSIAETFLYLATEIINGNLLPKSDKIKLITHTTGDEVWFSAVNNSASLYYVNILCIDKTQLKVSLLYPINPTEMEFPYILLPPKNTVDLKNLIFLSQPDVIYLLIATSDYYDNYSLYFYLNNANLSQPHNELYKDYIITY